MTSLHSTALPPEEPLGTFRDCVEDMLDVYKDCMFAANDMSVSEIAAHAQKCGSCLHNIMIRQELNLLLSKKRN